MGKKLLPFFIILAFPVVILLFFTLFQFQRKIRENVVGKKVEPTPKILTDDKGNPVMASGNCNLPSDCFLTGCSSQVCANHEVITTCEAVEFPEKATYSCGCIDQRCLWYKKEDR